MPAAAGANSAAPAARDLHRRRRAKAGRASTTIRIATDVPGKPTMEVVVSVDITPPAETVKPAAAAAPVPKKRRAGGSALGYS